MKNELLIATAIATFPLHAIATSASQMHITTPNKVVEDGKVFGQLQNNATPQLAGALTVDTSGSVTIGNNVKFTENSSSWSGGAMKALSGFTIGDNVEFTKNTTEQGGGGIYIRQSPNTGASASDPQPSTQATIGKNANFTDNKAGGNNYSSWLGGAIAVEYAPVGLNIGENASFSKNKADKGGAIAVWTSENTNITNKTTSKLILEGANFTSNEAKSYGGAIYNEGNTIIRGSSTFLGNKAAHSGGAIHNWIDGKLTVADGVEFKSNEVTTASGGALFNASEATLGDNIKFEENKAIWGGGAISSGTNTTATKSYKLQIGKNAQFINNTLTGTNQYGGAIFLDNDGKTTNNQTAVFTLGDNAYFSGNKAIEGGAMYIKKDVEANIGQNAEFYNNEAVSSDGEQGSGGAIYNSSNMTIDSAKFGSNEAAGTGGAIYVGQNSATLAVKNSQFSGNVANQGGAIVSTRSSKELTVENTNFTGNKADKGGGAIWSGSKTTVTGGTFANNEISGGKYGTDVPTTPPDMADEDSEGGAAIFMGSSSQLTVNGTIFENNTSNTVGGAIATRSDSPGTTSKLTVENATFTNNTAAMSGGAINIASANEKVSFNGKNVFSGNKAKGALNDIHNLGELTVNGDLTLDGGISGTGKTIFENGSNLTVNTGVTKITNQVENKGATLNLKLDSDTADQQYALITDSGSLDNEFQIAQNNLYDIIPTTTAGTYDIRKKGIAGIAATTGANASQASTITAITDASLANSSNETFNRVRKNIHSLLQSSNGDDVKTALDAVTALAPDVAPLVSGTQTETVNQVFGAVGSRLSGGSINSVSDGMSSGDSVFEDAAMWVQGLFNKSKLDDTAKAKGFDADTHGIALGLETFITDDMKIGAGYAYNKTDIDGFMRKTDVDTHTAIIYGEYKPSNWYLNGIITYSWSDYEEDKDVMGIGVRADYDVDAFGLQAMTGYDMDISGIDVTPELGLRYVHIKQDSYRDSTDQRVSGNDSDVLTGALGAKIGKYFEVSRNINIKPEAKIAATYDLKNDKVSSVVTLANGSAYSVNGDALKRFGMEFGAGLMAEINDSFELSLGYEGKFRKNYQDHTGLINLKYKF